MGRIINGIQKLLRSVLGIAELDRRLERMQESLGRIENRQTETASSLQESDFRAFSQFGEDGIIQYLIRHINISRKIFVEFGVENYRESNTRFLLKHNNWSGLVMDGSEEHIRFIKKDELYWQYNLKAVKAFITRENINSLLSENGITDDIGILSIDIDGNDYWIWDAITVINPAIVIVEYNSRFGKDRAVTIPYQAEFVRTKAHPSGIYYGASLKAFCKLAKKKGYAFVGCDRAGLNAFFIKREFLKDNIKEMSIEEGFIEGKYRLTADSEGNATSLSEEELSHVYSTMPLIHIEE